MKKHNTLKKLKQTLSLLLAILLIATALPVNSVYASGSMVATFDGQNSGSSSSGDGVEIEGSDQWLKHLQLGGVQAYLYDTKDSSFITGTYDGTNFKVIQFLGIDNIYNNALNYDRQGALTPINTTSFGSVKGSEVYRANDYPFKSSDDGDTIPFYTSGYGKFTSNAAAIDKWLTAEKDDKTAANLSNILKTYWGDTAYSKALRNPNVVIVIEPLMLVEYNVSTEDNGGGSRRLHENISKEAGVIGYKYEVMEVYDHTDSGDICSCGYWKSHSSGPWVDDDNVYYYSDIYKEVEAAYPRDEYPDKWESIDEASMVADHLEVRKTPIYGGGYNIDYYYNMLLAPCRWVKENNDNGNKYRVYDVHNVPTWGLYSMYSEHLGTKKSDGTWDDSKWEKTFCFPIGYESISSEGASEITAPIYDNNDPRQLYYNNKRSTLGMMLYSPHDALGGDYIHHTNDYSTSSSSAADACATDGTDEPNTSYTYGSNIVVKTYETRNSKTGKLMNSLSYMQWGVPDTIAVEDEYEDKWMSSTFIDEYGHEKSRPYVDWMLTHPEEYTCNDNGEVLAKGSGYRVADWQTAEMSAEQANKMWDLVYYSNSLVNETQRVGYQYITKNFPAIASGKGEKFTVKLCSNGSNASAAGDENTLFVRLVRYVDDSGTETGTDPSFVEANGALTESKIATLVSATSLLDDDVSPQLYGFDALWLFNDDNTSWTDNHLRLGVGISDNINYSDRTLGYFLSWQEIERYGWGDFRQFITNQSANFAVRRYTDDWTGNQIAGIVTGIKTLDINKQGEYSGFSDISDGLNSTLLSKYTSTKTPSSSDVEVNTEIGNLSTSNDNRISVSDNVTRVDGSTDTYTANDYPDSDDTYPSGWADTDNSVFKLGIETLNTDSDLNISTKMENSSGVVGSTQVYNYKKVIPLVEMQYTIDDTATGKIERQNILTSRQAERVFSVNSYAAISYLNPVDIVVSSNMWAIDATLTQGKDTDWQKPNQVMKGGSIYSLSTSSEQKINITTIQMVNDNSDYDNSGYVAYSSDVSNSAVESNHNSFKDEVINKLKETYITQWLSDNIDDTNTLAHDDSGAYRVSGLTSTGDSQYSSENGYSNINKFNNNIELQSDAKYWFNSTSDRTADSGNFDIVGSENSKVYYKFICNTDGCVYMLKGNDIEFSNPTVTKILEQNEGIDKLSNQEAMQLNNSTNALTNMLNTIVRDTGNDVNASWSSKNGHWYNEYASISLVKINTQVKMCLAYPSQRTCVIDPHLQPNSSSKLDMGTLALKSNFTTNWSTTQKLGTFLNQDVYLDKARTLFRSRNIYIPNMSVQDNM